MTDPAQGQGGVLNTEEIRSGVLAEINDLRATAQAFGWEAIKSGSWFNEFLGACLSGYQERVIEQGGEAWLRGKYPGLPTEAIAAKLCELAEQTAAIAGSLSGAAASGAVLTAGAGIPMAITAVMAEVLYTVRLQLRLVYDLHLLYGIPLDASDPEDLLGIFSVVYGVKLAELGGIGTKALGPEVMRAQLYRLIHGNTKAIQAAVNRVLGPRIARSVTQKGILKTAVPVVGVALSAGWNYTATRTMGSRVRQEVLIKAALREEALRLQARVSTDQATALAVVEGLLALALADGTFDDLEREVYLAFLRQLQLSPEQLETLASRVHADLNGVLNQLRAIDDSTSREAIAHCFCLIAAADGVLKPTEQQTLSQLLNALDQAEQLQQAEELCARFRRETGVIGQAMGAVGDAVGSAAGTATEAMSSALGWMKSRLRRQESSGDVPPESDLEADTAELETAAALRELAELDRQLAAGSISLEAYRTRWALLAQRMQDRSNAQAP